MILEYPAENQIAEHQCQSFPVQEFPPTPRVKGEPVPVMETLKESLKANLASVNIIAGMLKTAQREQKVTQREYSALRGTLRNLQRVRI